MLPANRASRAKGWLAGVRPAQNGGVGRNLERLAEGFLRFVVLIAVAFVESVGTLADHIRTDGHALASVFAGPILSRSQQPRARAKAAVSLLYDQTVHLRAKVALEERLFAYMQPADNPGVLGFRNEHRILRGGANPPQPLAKLGGARWIAKLGGEFRQPRRVRGLCAANFQVLAFSIRCHEPALAFRRKRASTAGPSSSRSASAAIHRADREPCRRILAAARVASRFNRKFLLPMFRKAQLTAFLTKWRSSPASRSIKGNTLR